jgi:S1-C subfamily serine protease
LALGDAKIASVSELLKALQGKQPGTEAKLHVQRGDNTLTVPVKLGTPPGQ